MAKHTSIRFLFSPDGRTITEQVEGVKGNQCEVITGSIEDALGVVTKRKPTMDFYNTDERFERLEEEDWIGTCTTFNCALEPSRLEKLEDEDWR
tara:strand:- start:92 stop:373 length:282 start_codon:yes stop_codon:yes gene_type:complete